MDRQSVLFVVAHRTLERRLRPSLEQYYHVEVARLRREVLTLIDETSPDLIVMDVPSVRFNIHRFFETLAALDVQVRSFLLLGKGMRLDQMPRANGYLRHPFTARQLVYRLGRVIPAGPREMIGWQGLSVDIENHLIIWRDQQIPLTPKQSALASVFLRSPCTTVSREHLMHEVWGTDYMGDTRTLDVHIHWLRKALAQVRAPFELRTERGHGYRLCKSGAEAS